MARAVLVLSLSSHSSTGSPRLVADGACQTLSQASLRAQLAFVVIGRPHHNAPGFVLLGQLGNRSRVDRP